MSERTKILIVDDVASQRLALEAALADVDEEVLAAGSGVDALRLLLEHDVAVILLDVNMPGMDGFETASLIRQRPRSRHTPIIFLTADSDEMLVTRAYALGAVDFLFNPFAPDVLRAKVKVFVDLAKMRERVRRDAERQIALHREQAARVAAEEESRRLRMLAEASGILTRSLDTATLIGDLLVLFVPLIADVAALAITDASGRAELSWLGAGSAGRVSHDPIAADGGAEIEALIQRVIAAGQAETVRVADGRARGVVLPLVARGTTFGALAAARPPSGAHYSDADLDLLRDIASRAAITLDNSRLYREIQDRDRQKDEFLAMLSHELRNPLGAITTAIRLLGSLGANDGRAVRAREIIDRQASHLARMVDDLLDVARLTTGRIALARAPLDLAEVVERSVDATRVSGRLEHHQVTVRAVPVIVEGDRARMEQIVTNLLVNAAKYTDRGGRIEVDVSATEREASVRVRDTGIGISREMLPHVFDLFAQGRQALDRAQGGLGIGLTLVRRLVELQGGRVEAWSDGPGAGSVFTVRLPRVVADVVRLEAAAGPQPATVPALRILVVEDNADAREMLRALLEQGGHEVHEASDGLEALAMVARLRPELALIDLGLPGLDGLELASRIRAVPDGQAIVLIAVTGYGQAADRRLALEAGFDLHLVKPLDPERLTEVLLLTARRGPERKVLEPNGS
jgi:CheY-like chemotaxis protein